MSFGDGQRLSGMLDTVSEQRTPRIYEVRSTSPSGQVHAHGARRSHAEAEQLLRELVRRVRDIGGRVVDGDHWITEIDTTGLFELPPRPTPRERYTAHSTVVRSPYGSEGAHVDVLDGDTIVATYDRNYRMLQTFEPFRQGERDFALIAPHYTATSVLDLRTGEIVATEEPSCGGFCPVGFYVPDWWDIHDGVKLPGTTHWRPADDEWPTAGDFGFVWGCQWGDDTTWKVQYLDLSAVREGVIRRDERFGYIRLAADPKLAPQDFIRCSSANGERRVQFYVEDRHELDTGGPITDEDW